MLFDKYFHTFKKQYLSPQDGPSLGLREDVEWWPIGYDITIGFVSLLVVLLLFFFAFSRPPVKFPGGEIVEVEEGKGVSAIARDLAEAEIIKSPLFFKFAVLLRGESSSLVAGDYYFPREADMFTVIDRVVTGDHGLSPFLVTIHEGLSVPEVARILDKRIREESFDRERFIELAAPFEGYLFPDTYFFLPNATEEEVIETMRENFEEHIREVAREVRKFGLPLEEVIIMASIIEKEASDFEDRRTIASVLWNRIEIDMALQVDAPFAYSIGKSTFNLTKADLAEDQPFNTYVNTGLPPSPIVSPGLEAILATVTPIESNYLFYLADSSGTTHFSETFEEHVAKRRQYLN